MNTTHTRDLPCSRQPPGTKIPINELLRLADVLAELPEAQREAIVLHHFEQRTVDESGRQLDRSVTAVAGLIKRGLRTLRLRLSDAD